MYLMVYHKLKLYLIPDMVKTYWYCNNDHIRITSDQLNLYEYTNGDFEYMFMAEDFTGSTSVPSWMKTIEIGDRVFFDGDWYNMVVSGDIRYLQSLMEMKISFEKANIERAESEESVLSICRNAVEEKKYLLVK